MKTPEEDQRADVESRRHVRETGHVVSWNFASEWICTECDAAWPPPEA